MTYALSFINMPILSYAGEIRSAVLMLHGENAHSRYFSEDAFKKLKGGNKELMIIPGANHTDLYDRTDKIPFDKIEAFLEPTCNKNPVFFLFRMRRPWVEKGRPPQEKECFSNASECNFANLRLFVKSKNFVVFSQNEFLQTDVFNYV